MSSRPATTASTTFRTTSADSSRAGRDVLELLTKELKIGDAAEEGCHGGKPSARASQVSIPPAASRRVRDPRAEAARRVHMTVEAHAVDTEPA